MNPRTKGAAGERQAAEWLKINFNLEIAPKRNLEQVRSGGYDLVGFEPFAFEIKRCQTLSLRHWWLQVVSAVGRDNLIPVVMYRRNREAWQFLVSATTIGLDKGFINLQQLEFVKWGKLQISLSKLSTLEY